MRGRRLFTIAVLCAMVLTSGGVTASAQAPAERAGDVRIVDASGQPVSAGDSSQMLSMRLPAGAACQGDSVDADYRVQGFLVPAEADPGTVTYGELGAQVEGAWFLVMENTEHYTNTFTEVAGTEGGEGRIPEPPSIRFDLFAPGEIPNGEYRIGIACTLANATTRYWDTDLTVTSAPDDGFAQLGWSTSGAGPGDGDASGVLIPLTIAGVVAAAAGFLLLRRRPSARPSKELTP